MVMWPWATIAHLRRELVNSVHAAEITAINLRTAERDLERLSNEHNLLQADFKALVAQTAGRLQPRVAPLDLDRDPFVENPKIPSEWLTEDGELPDFNKAEELLYSADRPANRNEASEVLSGA